MRVAVAHNRDTGHCGSGTPVGSRNSSIGMVSLSLVLDFLADERIRATYAAVATATGAPHARVLRTEPEFIQVDQRTAWVVLAAEGYQPPAAKHTPRPADSEIIRDGDDLARRAAEWGRSRTRAAGSTTTASDYGASEPELGDTSAPSPSLTRFPTILWIWAIFRGLHPRNLFILKGRVSAGLNVVP